MSAFLTQDWLDLHKRVGADLPARDGVTACLQMVVTGTPMREVAYVQSIEGGRVVGGELGTRDDVDVTLTCSLADATAIAKGELDLSAAFMQGRIKVVGNIGSLMAVMPLTQSPEYRALLEAVAAQTDF
ncbi:MAG: SCP2 sterol-binding domain-containing protein [Acidimicrobiales bacterium]